MTKTEYCVAPEDVMALLDGELSAADARVVSAHLEQCSECALLAERLRSMSESLSQWSVPAVPRSVEEFVEERVEKVSSWRARTRGKRLSFWKPLATGVAGVALGAMLVVAIGSGGYRRARMLQAGDAIAKDELRHVPEAGQTVYEQMGQAQMGKGPIGKLNLQDKASTAEGLYERKSRSGVSAVSNGVVGGSLDENPAAPPPPMIARVLSLTILVKDVDAARASVDSIVARHHGYSAQLSVSSPENGARNVRDSLRVPATELPSAAAELKALGRVEHESQSGEEVSQQHTDLVARLKTARETEARFQAILQQRTGRVSDVLEVEQNIARVRGEIEGMEAEQKALELRVDFATVEVQLLEEYRAQLGSQPASVSTRMHNAFVAGYRNATESLLGLVLLAEEYVPSIVIWLAILGLPAVVVWRRYKRIRAAL